MVPRTLNELLTPEEVLQRYDGGPKTGVFTDGSCEGNPGPGGWGFVWVEDDAVVEEKNGVDPATTNNRMRSGTRADDCRSFAVYDSWLEPRR